MFGFGKKKKAEKETASAEATSSATTTTGVEPKQAKRKKRPNELLSSVVHESEVGAAIDVMRQAERFVLPNEAGWVIALLQTDNEVFGGLSMKQSKDATKGSIVELIQGDQLQVFADATMLKNEVLGIILTPKSVDRMIDYEVFRKTPYQLATVYKDENNEAVVQPSIDTTFDVIKAVSDGSKDLRDVIPEVWEWALSGGEDIEDTEDVIATEDVEVEDVSEPDEADESDTEFVDDSEMPFGAGTAEESVESAQEEDVLSELNESEDDGDVDYESREEYDDYDDDDEDEDEYEDDDEDYRDYTEYLAQNEDRVFEADEIRDSIVRRFASDDLDLDIDLDVFYKTFNTEPPALDIEQIDSESWLGAQVRDFAVSANAEVAKLHADHQTALRQKYVELLSLHAEEVAKQLSTVAKTDEDGNELPYVSLQHSAKDDYERQLAESEKTIAKERASIAERFEKDADDVAKAAAEQARSRYIASHKLTQERLLSEVGITTQRRIEEKYNDDQQRIAQLRKTEGQMLFEMGITQTIKVLTELDSEFRDQELDLLAHWNNTITDYLDKNRRNEVVRIEVLDEQQRRTNVIEQMAEEYDKDRQQLIRQHDEKYAELEVQLVALRKQREDDLLNRDRHWQSLVDDEKTRVNNKVVELEAMQDRVDTADERAEIKYKSQIELLNADKARYEAEIHRMEAMQTRMNRASFWLFLAAVVAALVVGICIGAVLYIGGYVPAGIQMQPRTNSSGLFDLTHWLSVMGYVQ